MFNEAEISDLFQRGALLPPRKHQTSAIRTCLHEIGHMRREHGRENVLLQHTTGSGKTFTILGLAAALVKLKGELPSDSFACVLVLNDRIHLDEQITEQGIDFLRHNGIHDDQCFKARSVDDLRTKLRRVSRHAHPNGGVVIFSTLQKMSALLLNGPEPTMSFSSSKSGIKLESFHNILSFGRIAIVADEAHRSHGGVSSDRLNMLFRDPQKLCSLEQPKGLHYFAFTATPSPKALCMFGNQVKSGTKCSENDSIWKPHHLYSMEEAIESRVIHNVLDHYTCVSMNIEFGGSFRGEEERGWRIIRESKFTQSQLLEASSLHPSVLRYKAQLMAKHYCKVVRKRSLELTDSNNDDSFFPRAMVICRSRMHVVAYTRLLSDEMDRLNNSNERKIMDCEDEEVCRNVSRTKRMKVYGAFSGEIDTRGLGDTNSWLSFQDDENCNRPKKKSCYDFVVTESSMNQYSLDEANIIVVCNKLETGFDDFRLCVMYVDRTLQGAKCVQVLSRLNRTHPQKLGTQVIDFVNQPETIRDAFEDFFVETIFSTSQEFAKMKASLKCESAMSRILAALPREALLKDSIGPPTVTDQTKSAKNSVAAIVSALEHGTQSNLSQLGTVLDTSSGYCRSTFLQDLETYMALCETYSFQKCKNLCFFV